MNKNVNQSFYFFFALILIPLHFFHVFLIEKLSVFNELLFLFHAFAQVLAEISLVILIAVLVKKYAHRWIYHFFIGLAFVFFITHFIDFFLVRMMDLPFWFTLHMVLGESWENFTELLQLTGIPLSVWGLIALSGILVVLAVPIIAYKLLEKVRWSRSLGFSNKQLWKMLLFPPCFLFVCDLAVIPGMDEKQYELARKTLPWKTTLFPKFSHFYLCPSSLKCVTTPNIEGKHLLKDDRPNIYLFVSESLRNDAIHEKSAPYLSSFRKNVLDPKISWANANATHKSWYSIFHSNYALFWSDAANDSKYYGAPLLKLLKNEGYKIHLFSGAQLHYYHMDELLFGKDMYLLDSKHCYLHYPPKEACESDQCAMNDALSFLDQEEAKKGNVFVVFLDSTHFDYSYPNDLSVPYPQAIKQQSHIQISHSKDRMKNMKEKYFNSIYFVDSLFARFCEKLKRKNLYDQSIIVFTGDHGEEFYEEGQLFHASHLSSMQLEVPLFIKLGNQENYPEISLASHVDIMPTIADYLGIDSMGQHDGRSLLRRQEFPLVFSARFNFSRAPFEFSVFDGKYKYILQFSDRSKIHESKYLICKSIRNRYDETICSELEKRQVLEKLPVHLKNIFLDYEKK